MDYFIGGENMSTITEYNCPNCNAGLEFNPETQKWKCNYCFSEFNEDVEVSMLIAIPLKASKVLDNMLF